MRHFLAILFVMTMIPYVTTLAWTGRPETDELDKGTGEHSAAWESSRGESADPESCAEENMVIIVRNEKEYKISVEEFLIHVLAAQIPAEFEIETIKAQALLARTYIYGLMGERKTIYEEELDMDALSTEQMKRLWGEKSYFSNLAKLKHAAKETKGLYLLYEGAMIEPFFCYASAGKTRSHGETYPYLKQVESPGDLLAENYRSMPVFERKEFVRRINEIPGSVAVSADELADGGGIQIVERDSAGYVKQVQIGQKTYTGEEVQLTLGLASPCYSFERLGGTIRVICKGVGHGYGFSQFGANEMAKEGSTYEELLKYYFQNIEIVGR